jgi:hypothetical protein
MDSRVNSPQSRKLRGHQASEAKAADKIAERDLAIELAEIRRMLENLSVIELAGIRLMLEDLSSAQPMLDRQDPSVERKALPRWRCDLLISLDWKLAGVIAAFAMWILRSFVTPLVK